jgi:hypothetical protein
MELHLGILDGFAATVKSIVPLEVPFVIGVTLIHVAWLTADHRQPPCVVRPKLLLTALPLNET